MRFEFKVEGTTHMFLHSHHAALISLSSWANNWSSLTYMYEYVFVICHFAFDMCMEVLASVLSFRGFSFCHKTIHIQRKGNIDWIDVFGLLSKLHLIGYLFDKLSRCEFVEN